jgi:hypothetical protein
MPRHTGPERARLVHLVEALVEHDVASHPATGEAPTPS